MRTITGNRSVATIATTIAITIAERTRRRLRICSISSGVSSSSITLILAHPRRSENIEHMFDYDVIVTRYAELHVHTNYSFLDGASHPLDLVVRAAEFGYTALAVTDHDGFRGAAKVHVAAR